MPAPVVVNPTVPAPPAVTGAPIVSLPVSAVRLILPLPTVLIGAVVVLTAPVLATVTLPFAAVLLIPVTVNGRPCCSG